MCDYVFQVAALSRFARERLIVNKVDEKAPVGPLRGKYWTFWYYRPLIASLSGVESKKGSLTLPGTALNGGIGGAGSEKLRGRVVAGWLLAVAVSGCNARVQEERKVWNLFSIEAALAEGTNIDIGPAVPGGIPATAFLTQDAAGNRALKVQRAFADGMLAAYVTSEVWVNYYDAVWPQPLYAQSIDAGTDVTGAPRIIDVGPESAFYSPFWQVKRRRGRRCPADRYRSAKQLLDSGPPMISGGMKTCRCARSTSWERAWRSPPRGTAGTSRCKKFQWARPSTTTKETPTPGPPRFRTRPVRGGGGGARHLVEAAPMFVFTNQDGTWATDEPRVLGSGEVLGSTAGPRPRYGGLWRVHEVRLPVSAKAFHGDEYPDAVARATGDPLEYEGRYALDGACFEAPKDFPGGCVWLDSQTQLESMLGAGSLVATDVTQTGPIVLYRKLPVPVND